MKVSIITPTFNQDKYIGKCVESVLSQTYRNIEHVIVDNLSTDKTTQILSQFSHDKRMKFISERDKGQGDAVNKGVRTSTGDILMWLNSDDYLSSRTVVEQVVDTFQKDTKIEAVYGGVTFFNEKTNWQRYVPPLAMVYDFFRYIAFIGNSNIFVRRNILEKYQIAEQLHFVIDHEWLLRIFQDNIRYKRVPCSVTHFRRHDEAKTSVYDQDFKVGEGKIRDKVSGKRSYCNSFFLAVYRCWFYTLTLRARLQGQKE